MMSRRCRWILIAGLLYAATAISEAAGQQGGNDRPTALPPPPREVPSVPMADLPSSPRVIPPAPTADLPPSPREVPSVPMADLPYPRLVSPSPAAELPHSGEIPSPPAAVEAPMVPQALAPPCARPLSRAEWNEQNRWRREQQRIRRKCRCQDCFLGYPEEFEEVPLGKFLYAHGRTMVANGEAARMVLYQYDFVDCQPQLNQRGFDQLAKIARLLAINPAPLVIERTPCMPELAEARRRAVLSALASGPCPVPPERVVVGPARANGLSGLESELVYRNLLFQVRTEGARAILIPGAAGGGQVGGGAGGAAGGVGGAGGAGLGGAGGGGGGGFGGGGGAIGGILSSPIP
jgi:hypothetical protein